MTTETPTVSSEGSALSGVAPSVGAPESSPFDVPPVKVGLYRTENHQYFVDGEGPYPSVTTVLRVMHKPAIEADLKLEVGRAAVRAAVSGELHDWIVNGGDEEAARLLAERGTWKRDAAASFGTNVHALVEQETVSGNAPERPQDGPGGFPLPEGTYPYLEAFRGFLSRSEGLTIVSSEKAIFNLTEGYAGTYDFLARWSCEDHESCLWLFDLKTGKHWYADWALQLEAYRRGGFISLPNDPYRYPLPRTEHVAVLHLRPDKYPDTGYRILEYVTGDQDWLAFLAALDLFQWRDEKRFQIRKGGIRKR